MITDPFYVPYGRLNLDMEMWHSLRNMEPLLKLAEDVKKITEEGLVAIVSNIDLEEYCLISTYNTDIPAEMIPYRVSPHWSGLALAILCHCSKELLPSVTKFQKSPYDNEPYLDENVIFADWRVPYSKNVLKSKFKSTDVFVKPLPAEPAQLSLF